MKDKIIKITRKSILILILSAFTVYLSFKFNVFAADYFDEDDKVGLQHLSKALNAWYQTNKLRPPQKESDIQHFISLLLQIGEECNKVPDKTLNKISDEYLNQWRSNLQKGAKLYGEGMRQYTNALKKNEKPTEKSRKEMNEGQQLVIKFHHWYNSNYEKIKTKLEKNGINLLEY